MIYKGIKYACGTCIKGHRSSNCNHVERPLFEIRKKGRPVTQCSFCRDLRKTKQVHIKCACTHKSTKEQQPILIYQTEEASVVPEVPEVRDSKCTCSDLNHDHHLPNPQDDAGGLLSHTSSALTGGIGAPPTMAQQQSVVDPSSFSWAVVTPTPEKSFFANDDNVNLGFIFHKSSSQRFLEGQPRPPRKKSMKKQSSSSSATARAPSPHASSTTTTIVTPATSVSGGQQNFMLPLMDLDLASSSSSTCSDNNTLSADLTMILNNVLKPLQHEFPPSDEDAMNHELANLDLTQTNGMMYPVSSSATTNTATSTCGSTPGTPPHLHHQQQPYFQQLHSHTSSSSSPSSATSYFSNTLLDSTNDMVGSSLPFDQVGCCGSYSAHSMCRSDHSGPGESVVITIAPLSATTNNPLQGSDNVRTKIVTCYCTGNCTCPGCLVHPGNFLMGGDPFVDPYRGLSSSTCPSSTASSIYSNSDDEDQQQQQQSILL